MLTGEYFVLDGAISLALPTLLGQKLDLFEQDDSNGLQWKSIDQNGNVWFEAEFRGDFQSSGAQPPVAEKLLELLRKAKAMNPKFTISGLSVEISSEFNLQWGLGSSSTLVSLIAQWASVDPYELQFECFGGSGYDIACATAKGPIIYNRWPEPYSESAEFKPTFSQHLNFVYLGQKQDSRKGINQYKQQTIDKSAIIDQLNEITKKVLKATNLAQFQKLLDQHENLVSQGLGLERVKERFFNDFNGSCKSLGAWGGDFILAASELSSAEVFSYFQYKGFNTVVPYAEMVLLSD